jgi:hypothetical protein
MTTELAVADLSPHLNNVGTSLPAVDVGGGFDGMGRTFPNEEMAPLVALLGRPIAGWGRGAPDNVTCEEQVVELGTPVPAAGLVVVGFSDGGSMQDAFLAFDAAGRSVAVQVGLTDGFGKWPAFSNTVAVAFSHLRIGGRDTPYATPKLWRADVASGTPLECRSIVLPFNPAMHVFALAVRPVRR